MRSFFSKIIRQTSSGSVQVREETGRSRQDEGQQQGSQQRGEPGASAVRSFFRIQGGTKQDQKGPGSIKKGKKRYNSSKRQTPSQVAYIADESFSDMAKEDLDKYIILAEDILPGLLVESLRERQNLDNSSFRHFMKTLGGHVSVVDKNSNVVLLHKARSPKTGLTFQTMDILEQIVCCMEDGPDACAAVGLPAQLIRSLASFERFSSRARSKVPEMDRSGSLSSELTLDDEALVEDEVTDNETDEEQDGTSAVSQTSDNPDRDKSSSNRIKHSEALFRRISATLCHLVGHVAVELSLLREPENGLALLFQLVQVSYGNRLVLDVFEAMAQGRILPAVLDYVAENNLLRQLVQSMADYLQSYGEEEAEAVLFVDTLSAVVSLLLASCRTSQILLENFRDSGGYLVLYESLLLMPSQTETIVSLIRQLIYLGRGYDAAEQDAENLGVVHSIYLARNESAFALVSALLCHLQFENISEGAEIRTMLAERHSFASGFFRPAVKAKGSAKSEFDANSNIMALGAIRNVDVLRLPLLHCVLTVFSSNPVNFGILENKFGLMATLLVTLGTSECIHDEFLYMVIKLLELISMGMDYRPKPLLETVCQRTIPDLFQNRLVKDKVVSRDHISLSLDLNSPIGSIADPSIASHESEERESKKSFDSQSASMFVAQVLFKTLIKMIHSDDEYKALLHDSGVFHHVIVPCLQKCATGDVANDDPELFGTLPLLCSFIQDLLEGSPTNEETFRSLNGHKALYALLPIAPKPVLGILFQLSKADSPYLSQDISTLFELAQINRENRELEVDILGKVLGMMQRNHKVKDILRKCGGFESLLAILLSLESSFSPENSAAGRNICVLVMEKIFQVLTVSMTGNHIANRMYLKEEIRYESISSSCQLIGIFGSEFDHKLVDMILDCITEAYVIRSFNRYSSSSSIVSYDEAEKSLSVPVVDGPKRSLRIRNVDPLQILTIRLSLLSAKGLKRLVSRLTDMVYGDQRDAPANCEILSGTLVPKLLMQELFDKVLCDASSDMHDSAVKLFGSLLRHHSTTKSIQQLFEITFRSFHAQNLENIGALLRLLNEAASPGADDAFLCPYIQMAGPSDMFLLGDRNVNSNEIGNKEARKVYNRTSHMSIVDSNAAGNINIAGLGKRSWPPNAGYTLSMWVWLGENVGEEILLASFRNLDGQQLLRVTLEPNNSIKCATCAGSDSPGASMQTPASATSMQAMQAAFQKINQDMRNLMKPGDSTMKEVSIAAMSAAMAAAEASASLSSAVQNERAKRASTDEREMRDRIVRTLAPASIIFDQLDLHPGRWNHILLVHRVQANISLLMDKSWNSKVTLYLNGAEAGTQKFPYPSPVQLGGLKTSVYIGMDPIATVTRKPNQSVRFWRLGPVQLLDVPKDVALAKSLFVLGPNYSGTFSRTCATLKDARAFTTTLLEKLFSYEKGKGVDDHIPVVHHLEKLGLPHSCWKDLLHTNNAFLHEKGTVDLESVVFLFYAGCRTILEGFPSIDTKSLVAKNIKEIDVPRTVLMNPAIQVSTQSTGQQPVLAVLGGGSFAVTPLPLSESIRSIGGVTVILRLLELSRDPVTVVSVLQLLRSVLRGHEYNRFIFRHTNGHRVLAWLLFGIARNSKEVFTPPVFESMLNLAVLGSGRTALVVDTEMLHQLILNHQVWRGAEGANMERWSFVVIILQWLSNLVDQDNQNVMLNFDALHRLNIIDWVLEIMLALAVDTPSEPGAVSDVFTAALQFLHNICRVKVLRRSLFELFKHILVSLPVNNFDDEEVSISGETELDFEGGSTIRSVRSHTTTFVDDEDFEIASQTSKPSSPLSDSVNQTESDAKPPNATISCTSLDAENLAAPDLRQAEQEFIVPPLPMTPTIRSTDTGSGKEPANARKTSRRRTVTDMMMDKTGRWAEMRRGVEDSRPNEVVSEQGALILKKVRCMLFQLLLDLPNNPPDSFDHAQYRKAMYEEYSEILSIQWFTSLMCPPTDDETYLLAFRLLVEILQESPDFARHFGSSGGFEMISSASSLHPQLLSILMSLLVLLFGIPASELGPALKSGDYAISSSTGRTTTSENPRISFVAGEEKISSFVSPEVKRRLLTRKSTVESMILKPLVSSNLGEDFETLCSTMTTLHPPLWYLDVYACLFALLQPLLFLHDTNPGDRDHQHVWDAKSGSDVCVDIVHVFSHTIGRFPDLQWMFTGTRSLEISSRIGFEEAALLKIKEQASVFTGPVSQALLSFYGELLTNALAEDSVIAIRRSTESGNHAQSSTMGGTAPDSPSARAIRARPQPIKDSRKLLELMMQSFPAGVNPLHALWFQTALVQALLPSLSLILDDNTWAARESSGRMMNLPYNADPGKVVSLTCFITGRASFGWIPAAEHTILELILQAYRCMNAVEYKMRILRCIRGLVLWNMYTAEANNIIDEEVQLLRAILRNFDVLQVDRFFSSLVTSRTNSGDIGKEPYIPASMIPLPLRQHFDFYDESAVFALCSIHLCLSQLKLAQLEVKRAIIDLLHAMLHAREVLFSNDPTLKGMLECLENAGNASAEWIAELDVWLGENYYGFETESWLARLWLHVQKIELFGSHVQCGLRNVRLLRPKPHHSTEARAELIEEVLLTSGAQKDLMEQFIHNQKRITEDLSKDSLALMDSLQKEAVDRHRRWQRVGLEHLLRGKRLWKQQGDDFLSGVYSGFFRDSAGDADGADSKHWKLDLSEAKDRMRRRTNVDLEFDATFRRVQFQPEAIEAPTLASENPALNNAPNKMEDEMNLVLRSIQLPKRTEIPSRLRSMTEVDGVCGSDIIDDDLEAVQNHGLMDIQHPPERSPALRRKVKSLQLPSPSILDHLEFSLQANEKSSILDGDDPPPSISDLPNTLSGKQDEAEFQGLYDQDLDIGEPVISNPQRKGGPFIGSVSMNVESGDGITVPTKFNEVSDPINEEEDEDNEYGDDGEDTMLKDDLKIKNRSGSAASKGSDPSRSISPPPRSPGGGVNQGLSLEDEMAALGWENAERIFAELDQNDRKPERIVNCLEVNGLEATRGVCLICEGALYFATNYLLSPAGNLEEVAEEDGANTKQMYEAVLVDGFLRVIPNLTYDRPSTGNKDGPELSGQQPKGPSGVVSGVSHNFQRVRYDTISEVYRRRYMFSEVGLELFAVDGSNFLLVFDSPMDRDWVFTRTLSKDLPNLLISKSDEMQGLARSTLLNPDGLSLGAMMAPWRRFRASVTRKWKDGEISNFAYLVYLNTLAGRSHNDLTQYPVFPWVLQQYTEETLDLEDPASFRDLSKPMGALNPERAKQFAERYGSLASVAEETQIKPFHYGTHYSCSAYVLQFLIRLEPFTHMALELQGGQFDRPDRLFNSVVQSWRSVSGEDFNAQDVRELIPEFYYLPDFFTNVNRIDFGITQRGKRVDDVELPKWAHGDPQRFVRLHRRALESKFVSEHLHEWIDLIFGYKQRGRAAIDAQNVFHPLTYEGEVNPDEIQDPLVKKATLAQIHNFGQTPRKLFSKPHPRRVVPLLSSQESIHTAESTSVQWHSKLAPPLVIPGSYSRPMISNPGLMGLDALPGQVSLNRLENVALRLVGPAGPRHVNNITFTGPDKLFGVTGLALLVPPANSHFITWGSENGSLCLHSVSTSALNYSSSSEKLVAVFESLHNGPISACAITSDGKQIWTGGADALVGVWRMRKQKAKSTWLLDQVVCLASHKARVTALATCMGQGIALSGSKDGAAVLWDLEKKRFIRQLKRDAGPIASVSINENTGTLLVLAGFELSLWHVNGIMLSFLSLNPIMNDIRLDQPKCALITNCDDYQDGVVAVTGHSNGVVALWDLPELAGKRAIELRVVVKTDVGQSISSLSIDASGRRLACGDIRGNIFAWGSAELGLSQSKAAEFFNRNR